MCIELIKYEENSNDDPSDLLYQFVAYTDNVLREILSLDDFIYLLRRCLQKNDLEEIRIVLKNAKTTAYAEEYFDEIIGRGETAGLGRSDFSKGIKMLLKNLNNENVFAMKLKALKSKIQSGK